MKKKIIFLILIISISLNIYAISKPKVILASILIPGGGEYLLGNKKVALSMFISEGLIWAGYFSFNWYGNNIKNNFMDYAGDISGANSHYESENYWDAVEWYVTAESYNLKVREDARQQFPNDWEAQQRYIEENSYTGDYAWDWTNKESQFDFYKSMRTNSRQMFQNASYLISGAVLTRVVSFVWTVNSIRQLPAMQNVEPEININQNSYRVGFSLKF